MDYSDLPPRKMAVTHLGWRDDLTCLTAWSDGNALELTLRDCPPAHPDGAPLPAFAGGSGRMPITRGSSRLSTMVAVAPKMRALAAA